MLRRAAKRAQTGKTVKEAGLEKRKSDKIRHDNPLGYKEIKDDTEKALEDVVLGGEDSLLTHLEETYNRGKKKRKKLTEEEKPQPAWEDDDDATDVVADHQKSKSISGKKYREHLRNKFKDISGAPSWAKLRWERTESDHSSDEDEVKDVLQRTGNYLRPSESLPKGMIQMKRCGDVNQQAPSKGKLHSVAFHPSAQVMLAAGTDHTLRLFQVDGKTNPLIQSVFMERFPIVCAHFNPEGTEVVMGSIHKSFQYFDMMAGNVVKVPKIKGLEEPNLKHFVMSPDGRFITFCGHYGRIHLISAKSKEWVSTLKMNGTIEAITYTPDGSKMLTHGGDGEVYVWDMQTRDCVHRFYDEGTVKGTALAVSPNGQYFATGSYSGVVNIYDDQCLTSTTPKPLKSVMNLTSPCTSLVFNSTTEILAAASNETQRALKLIHFPSLSVFSNFPEQTDPMRIPLSMDFSVNSGYYTVGTHKGHAHLYRDPSIMRGTSVDKFEKRGVLTPSRPAELRKFVYKVEVEHNT